MRHRYVVVALAGLTLVTACVRPEPEVVAPVRTAPPASQDGSPSPPTSTVAPPPTSTSGTSTTTSTTSTTTTTTTTTTSTTTTTTLPPLTGPSLFPERRVVALYGNDVTGVLGVLGEQSPEESVERLATVMSAWTVSDRPVQGAFELIATIATAAPGPDGLFRSRSSDARVQRYLDVAEAHGLLLILDIQPGRSDFLTEVRHYEAFLRHPSVHVALDPEWRLAADERPGRGHIGQVDSAEVNAVAEYVAALVAEEGLPDKLLVVHQFRPQMVTDRDLLVEPDGVTLTIHMDGFGTRQDKLDTYALVHADEPWNNGFKLFYDEDVDLFGPADVLALDPVPDLITYQ